jgi:tRNA 2-thiouridine synthesizing protein B
MLFTVNKSPLSTNNLKSVLRIAPPGALILLYEDGVYGVMPGNRIAPVLENALQQHPVYALDADIEARGIQATIEGIQVIGYDGFVQLVEQHNIVPWL